MKINFKELKFYNLPKKLTEKDYQEMISLAIQDLKKNPEIVAAYLMGKDWLPGISDVDLIVVYKDNSLAIHQPAPFSLSAKAKHIFTHIYYHFSLTSFKDIYYIMPAKYNLYHLFGQEVPFSNPQKDLSEKEYHCLKASFILDCLVNKLLPSFYIFKKDINVRRALLWLHSIIYTIALTEEIINKKIKTDFPEKIKSLRNNWFFEKKDKNLKLLSENLEDTFNLIPEIVKELDKFLRVTFNLASYPEKLLFNSPSFYLFGVTNWHKEKFFKESQYNKIKIPFLRKVLKQYKLALPNSFFSIFKIYGQGQGQGLYSQWFKQFLSPSVFDFKNSSQAINKRVQIFNQAPVVKDKEILLKTLLQYGFHTANFKKEKLKVKIISSFL